MKLFNLFLFIINLTSINSFIKLNFGKKFKISEKEISNNINYKISLENQQILKKISGFYGLIGPDASKEMSNDIFRLFNQNGVIQGVFINNGSIKYVRYYIKTDKLKYEEENGKIPTNVFTIILFEFLKNINLLPNLFGLANTALINISDRLFALNERDKPYELNIDFKNEIINTKKKIKIPLFKNFLAHSKNYKDFIETIDYSAIIPEITYYKMKDDFSKIKKIKIKTKYISMIHDFISLNNTLIIADVPMMLNLNFNDKPYSPLKFNFCKKSQFILINKTTGDKKYYTTNYPFFIFHYGHSFETESEIISYACIYDDFNFVNPKNNTARFRKIIFDKNSSKLRIEKNKILEKYNVEFPIIKNDITILMNIENMKVSSLLVVKDFKLKKIIKLDKTLYGEPSIIDIKGILYIICFTYDSNKNYMTVININSGNNFSIEIPYDMTLGFHSSFINNI
jgi:carotenoid cleavage dioxygenase-like enzyme